MLNLIIVGKIIEKNVPTKICEKEFIYDLKDEIFYHFTAYIIIQVKVWIVYFL